MLALVASGALIAYLLVPGFLFKFLFSWFIPLEKFRRTRTEELTFGAFTTLLPLILTFVLVLNVAWFGNHPYTFPDSSAIAHIDYKTAAASLYSESYFSQHQQDFWDASARIARRQGRVLIWLYMFTTTEALLFGWLGKNFGKFRRVTIYAVLAERLLIPNISSWYVLLTPFMWPRRPARKVIADLLTSDDHLYRGHVVGYEVNREGDLRGVLLSEALRFDRQAYLKDKDSKGSPRKEEYWKEIPGKNLFVFADKVSSINLSYLPPAGSIPGFLENVLKKLNIEAQVTVEGSSAEPKV